jgi:phosphoserine aminotransferase
MNRPYNFAPGPSTLPLEVLERARDEMLDWRGLGLSIMELSHRDKIFVDYLSELEQKIRGLMNIPKNYKVLFMSGGGQGQFAAVPINLTGKNKDVDYFDTGVWSDRAIGYAKKYAKVNIVTKSTKSDIPDKSTWQLNKNAAYAYYCPNETINGIMFPDVPNVGNVPLIADMTSSIMSFNIDVSRFGVIFASAQKNLGQSGVTLVIVRDDLLEQQMDITPTLWSYKHQSEQGSCVNTVPVYATYIMDLMVDWMIKQGGINELEKINYRKAEKLYNCIDNSDGFYTNPVSLKYRSLINVPFELPNKELMAKFLVEAKNNGLEYLNGHALVGGGRASLYNAMPEAGVDKLVSFMQNFAKNNH